jgi:hypothetical protein
MPKGQRRVRPIVPILLTVISARPSISAWPGRSFGPDRDHHGRSRGGPGPRSIAQLVDAALKAIPECRSWPGTNASSVLAGDLSSASAKSPLIERLMARIFTAVRPTASRGTL